MHLISFAYLYFWYIPNKKEKKLEDESEQMILVYYYITSHTNFTIHSTKIFLQAGMLQLIRKNVRIKKGKMVHHFQTYHFESIMIKMSIICLKELLSLKNMKEDHKELNVQTRSLQYCDVIFEHVVTPDRNLMHLVLFVHVEPLSYEEICKIKI